MLEDRLKHHRQQSAFHQDQTKKTEDELYTMFGGSEHFVQSRRGGGVPQDREHCRTHRTGGMLALEGPTEYGDDRFHDKSNYSERQTYPYRERPRFKKRWAAVRRAYWRKPESTIAALKSDIFESEQQHSMELNRKKATLAVLEAETAESVPQYSNWSSDPRQYESGHRPGTYREYGADV